MSLMANASSRARVGEAGGVSGTNAYDGWGDSGAVATGSTPALSVAGEEGTSISFFFRAPRTAFFSGRPRMRLGDRQTPAMRALLGVALCIVPANASCGHACRVINEKLDYLIQDLGRVRRNVNHLVGPTPPAPPVMPPMPPMPPALPELEVPDDGIFLIFILFSFFCCASAFVLDCRPRRTLV